MNYKNIFNIFNIKNILIVFIFLFIINALVFSIINHSDYLRADQWRFLELYLMPESFTLSSLWSDHHPQPLTALLFMVSEKYCALNVNLFAYVGIISKIIFSLLFLYIVNKTLTLNKFKKYSLFLLVTSIFYSLKSINEYGWGLVTLSNFWFLLYLIILLNFESLLKNIFYQKHFNFIILVFVLLLGARDLGIIMIASIVLFLIIKNIRNSIDLKKNLTIFLDILIAFILLKIFYAIFNINIVSSSPIVFDIHTANIFGIFNTFTTTLLSGFISINMIKKIALENYQLLILSYSIFAIYIFLIYISIKQKLYLVSSIPFVIIIYGFVFIVAIIAFRYTPLSVEIDWRVMADRYTKVYEISAMAMVWGYIIYFQQNKINKIIFYTLTYSFIVMNIFTIVSAWEFSKYVVNSNKTVKQALVKCSYDKETCGKLPRWAIGNSFSRNKLIYLKENNLNIFKKEK